MPEWSLEKLIAEYMALFSGRIAFVWHGGEPLLAGISFFQRIVELQKKHLRSGQSVRNSLQTNGTLINDQWATFFKEHGFRIGVSLDGTEETHNRFRKMGTDGSSYDRVLEGITTLRRNGIEPGIIQTITRSNLKRYMENFQFFVHELHLNGWGINPFLDVGAANDHMRGESLTSGELYGLLKQLIDFWISTDNPNLCIREIENLAAGVFGKQTLNCSYNGCCTGFFCVEHDGRVYPCDRLTGHPEYLFGDLSSQPLHDILNSSVRLHYASAANSLHPECAACEWQSACHNGCTHHRLGDVSSKYYFCDTRKQIFPYLKSIFENYGVVAPILDQKRRRKT